MSKVVLFKTKHAVLNSARPKDGEQVTVFVKAQHSIASVGDIAVVYTSEKQETPSPKACFVISSILVDGDPVCYPVVIEKVDTLKKASHLVSHPGGFAEVRIYSCAAPIVSELELSDDKSWDCASQFTYQWTNLKGANTKVLYMNGAEISQAMLGSTQLEGVTVKLIRTKYTMQLSSDNCILLHEKELDFGDYVKSLEVQKALDSKEYTDMVHKLIKERLGSGSVASEFHTNDSEATNTGDESDGVTATVYNNGNGQTKREAEDDGEEAQNKKMKPSPDTALDSSPSHTPSSPEKNPPNITNHIAEVAQMVKEMDDEHSDRLSKVEMEVARIRSILQQHSLITSHLSVSYMSSPSLTTPSNSNSKKQNKSAKSSQKSRPAFTIGDIHPNELVVVRADKSVTPDAFYWMARVVSVGKSLVRVKWFEPCEFATNWYTLENKEDEIEVGTIFAKNFELTLKPVKDPTSGKYIDIYKPVSDLSKFDTYK